MARESSKQTKAGRDEVPETGEMSPGDEPLEEATSAEVKPKSQRRKKVKLEKVPASEPPKVAEIPETPPMAQTSSDPQHNASASDGAAVSPELKAELDADEAEFRALRRDLDGVKGSSAAGIVAINVDKAPPRNTFFRTHPTFNPTVSIVSIRQGMDDHFYAVTPDMVAALRAIGITASDHTLYFTVTPEGATTVVPIRQGTGDREQNEYARTKEIGLRRGRDEWVRLWTDEENHVYEVYPAPKDFFDDPQWPELTHAKIFRLAFRDKGRLIDSVEHPLFLKWAALKLGDTKKGGGKKSGK